MACDYQYYKDPNSYYPMLYCYTQKDVNLKNDLYH